jgi:hypothetical protein
MQRRKRGQIKLKKESCEICGDDRIATLNIHHIIPRCDPRSSNNNNNLAILCHNCHDLVHAGELIILGVYPSTAIGGRTLMWHRNGSVIPLEEIDWKIKNNTMVLRKIN